MGDLVKEMLKQLQIREVKSLLPHEQTMSYNLKRLKVAMLNVGQLADPIIIDDKTNLVMDGNHRLKVLEIIECPYAVCQTVDYKRDDIKVGTWFPTVSLKPEEIFKLDSIKTEKVDIDAGKDAVNNLQAPFALIHNAECYLLNPGKYKLLEMVEEQNYILSLIEKKTVDYLPDEEVPEVLEQEKSVFFRRAYSKKEILKAAQDHNPFPPKSTRHLIPGRILRLNMRLGWLHRTPEDASKELERMLNHRVYQGNVRRYYEPVTVIY
jgi:hypothetical protein